MSRFGEYVKRFGLLFFAILFLVTSVGLTLMTIWQDRQQKQAENSQDAGQAQNLNEDNALQGKKLDNFTPVASVTELQRIDQVVGTGAEVAPGATITAHYTGALASDGTIFQSSLDTGQPIQFSLDGVIEGWTQGVPGMKEGDTRRLLIPAAMAYGANPPPGSGIPANADLVFDIVLVSIDD
jgi:FKBP-type peptidyl-prolyl cis-trans isomerase